MDFLSIFRLVAVGLAGTIVGVLHATGADKHKTIAGQIAGVLGMAAQVAQVTHDTLAANAGNSPPQTATAPTAASTA